MITPDFYPTFLELAGLSQRNDLVLDGRSMVPLLRGENMPERPLFWHFPHYDDQGGQPCAAVCYGRYKYLMLYDEEKKLLFTGDTFYPAALYVDLNSKKPVTELLAAYQKTMAELAKQFGDYTLICSHNEPVCDGSYLGRTAAALGEVLAGKAPDEIGSTGLKRYEYEGFAIITH